MNKPYLTQTGRKYYAEPHRVNVKGTDTVLYIAISEDGIPALHSDGLWVFPTLSLLKSQVKKWR